MAEFFNIKKRAISLADNILAALVLGGSGVISWLAARSAYLTGRPLWQSIGIGVGFLLVIALAANFVSLAIARLRQGKPFATSGCPDSWLHEIAKTQAKAIAEYVIVESWIIEHDLLRDAPFIDFQVSFRSACVYDLSFAGISGAVRFANQRLSETVIATQNLVDRLKINEVGWVTVRQPLTRDEVTRILNQPNEFFFDYIRIELRAEPGINDAVVVRPRGSVKSEVLYDRYPKLDIKIKKSLASWVNDSRDGIHTSREPYYATLQLSVTNDRRSTIVIETFKLVFTVEGKQYVGYAESGSHVSLMRYIAKDGNEATSGIALPNLNASPPLKIPQDGSITGAVQFTFEQIDYNEYLGHFIGQIGQQTQVDPLSNIPFRLCLIDKNGEEHWQSGNLNFGHD